VGNAAAGGNPTIGLRCPSHPVAKALLNWGRSTTNYWGLAAPSANQFGRVSPTTAAHVQGEFGDDLLILDGGACSVGIESSIIDCTRGQPVLLRPGAITPEQVLAVCGFKVLLKEELTTLADPSPKASGTLESHYAPKARVRLFDAATQIASAIEMVGLALWSRAKPAALPAGVVWRAMPLQAEVAAQQLFAVLREFDDLGVNQIWIETPPDGSDWDGVRDRLHRAAS
jgi:L-threonylcarbamoyladenylate synthase